MTDTLPKANPVPEPVRLLGLPLMPLTMSQTIAAVNALIAARRPSFFITAILNYAMLCSKHAGMDAVNRQAAFIVADGMPLVWLSRSRLPERVAGADLIFELAANAAREGHRVAIVGGRPGVAELAVERLRQKNPAMNVVSIEVPPFRSQSPREETEMIQRIRLAQPDLLIGAFSQPHGEQWMAANRERLNVPVCVQLGAALDFAAGGVSRAPQWISGAGCEWLYRMAMEPRRLAGRYFRNGLFMARQLLTPSRLSATARSM